jgi:hypothetical protein
MASTSLFATRVFVVRVHVKAFLIVHVSCLSLFAAVTTTSTTRASSTTTQPARTTLTSTRTQSATDTTTGGSAESARMLNTPTCRLASVLNFAHLSFLELLAFLSLSFLCFHLSILRIRVSSWSNSCCCHWGWSWCSGYFDCSHPPNCARAAPQANQAAEARWRHWTESHSSAFVGAHP